MSAVVGFILICLAGCAPSEESEPEASSDAVECGEPDGAACEPNGGSDTLGSRDGSGFSDTGESNSDSGTDSGGLTDCEGNCESLSTTIDPMDGTGPIAFGEGAPDVVDAGPNGGDVLRFEGRGSGGKTGRVDAKFSATIDLASQGIDLRKYDLMKLQVKADRAAFLHVAADNVPDDGTKANWWVLDALRGPIGWRTIWMDLDLPETVDQEAGTTSQKLHIQGYIKDTGRSKQPDERRIWLGELRAARRAVSIDWDQTSFTTRRTSGGDLVYEYPVEVRNELSQSITAELALEPKDAPSARASLEKTSLELGGGATETVRASLRLPAESADEPLYTERFRLDAQAANISDSRVTILRSSDPIYLPVTVPIAENKLDHPILPPPEDLPSSILHFDESEARSNATRSTPAKLVSTAASEGISNYSSSRHVAQFRKALVSAAYLYRKTGEKKFRSIGTELLSGLPRIWKEQAAAYEEYPYPVVSSGIVTRWNDRWHYTLSLGWRLMGTQRAPYQYSRDPNASGGGMSAIFYAFDILAPHLEASERERIVEGFIVPAGIQCRNHYVGDGNQQATVNTVTLYAGLAARNWPLVAFAHSSSHSMENVLEWTFTDDGVHLRDGYQTYSLRPIFWSFELLHRVGLDPYQTHESRVRTAVDQGYNDGAFWNWVVDQRY